MRNDTTHESPGCDGTVPVNGTWVYYRVEGSGLPCLVMPATWGLDHTLYTSLVPLLDQHLQLVFVDPRGVGKSGPVKSEEEFGKETLVNDAAVVLGQLGRERTVLFGHSGGGFCALKFALAHPHKVSHLILVSTAGSGTFFQQAIWQGHHKQNRFIVDARERYRKHPTAENFRNFLRRIWQESLVDSEKIIFLEEYLQRSDLSLARSKYFSTTERAAFDVRSELGNLAIPTLVIAGREDPQIPIKYSEDLARRIANARFVVFEESGHYPWIEEPVRFVSEIQSFLRLGEKEGEGSTQVNHLHRGK